MNAKILDTPVLFLIFNRPDTTRQVFSAIRAAKPRQLFIAADGPRKDKKGESEKCRQTREIALDIDWPCEVKTLFRENNLGCKIAVSSGIDWFFDNVEQGIILEDDCLPNQSFFWFCQELLGKYKDDSRIMCIAGMTYVEKENNPNSYSYHFCRVGGIWGWASWRRAWKLYELEMQSYPQAIEERVFDDLFIGEKVLKNTYLSWFKNAYRNTFTWDYQWTYTKIINNSINIMPAKNLVKNIGFGIEGATNTTKPDPRFSEMIQKEMKFPLIHPKFIVIDRKFNFSNFEYTTRVPLTDKLNRYLYNLLYYMKLLLKTILPESVVEFLKNLRKNVKSTK
ncbi:MAG: hypothetical protein Q8P86_01735 [bacterium]|nr:hypothetical protein [bacterium]